MGSGLRGNDRGRPCCFGRPLAPWFQPPCPPALRKLDGWGLGSMGQPTHRVRLRAGGLGGNVQRYLEMEGSALAGDGIHPDASAMRFDDGPSDPEAQSDSATVSVARLPEGTEDVGNL